MLCKYAEVLLKACSEERKTQDEDIEGLTEEELVQRALELTGAIQKGKRR